MATLITVSAVQARFPLWENYLSGLAAELDGTDAEDLLLIAIEDAEWEFGRYVDVDSITDMTDAMTADLMHLIRYEVFMQKHGDTEFDKPPAIVERYINTRNSMLAGLVGTGNIVIEARERVFDEGFHADDEDNDSLTNED